MACTRGNRQAASDAGSAPVLWCLRVVDAIQEHSHRYPTCWVVEAARIADLGGLEIFGVLWGLGIDWIRWDGRDGRGGGVSRKQWVVSGGE